MKKLISAIVILTLTVIIMSAAAVVSFAAEAPVAEWKLWTSESYLKDISKINSAVCDDEIRACTLTSTRSQGMTFKNSTADELTTLLNNVEYVHEGCDEDCEDHIKYMIITYSNTSGVTSIKQADNPKNYVNGSGTSVTRTIPIKNTGDSFYSVIVNVSGDNATRGTLLRSYNSNECTIYFYPTAGGSSSSEVYTMKFRSLAFTKTLDDAKAYCEGLWETGDSVAYHIDNEDNSTTGDLVERPLIFNFYNSHLNGVEQIYYIKNNYPAPLLMEYDDNEKAIHVQGRRTSVSSTSNQNTSFGISPINANSDEATAIRQAFIDKEESINYMVITYRNPNSAWNQIQHFNNHAGNVRTIAYTFTEQEDYYSVILDLTGTKVFKTTNKSDETGKDILCLYLFNGAPTSDTAVYDYYLRSVALTETLDEAVTYCEGLWETGDSAGYHVSDAVNKDPGILVTPSTSIPMIDVTINAENGSVTVNDGAAVEQYEQGSELTLVATPADGYKFVGWYDVTGRKFELLTDTATYNLTVAEAIELKARFESTASSEPVFVYDLYNNKDSLKHVIHANNFTSVSYDDTDKAYKVTGSGAQKEVSFSLNSNSVDTSDAAIAAREALLAQEKDIGYMVVTYRNPDRLAGMTRRYIDEYIGANSAKDETFALKKSGNEYYSVIVDVSNERLWFRTGNGNTQSQLALYPFKSLSGDDENTYNLYFRSVALTKTLDDAKAYCESLWETGDAIAYHVADGDLVIPEQSTFEFDLYDSYKSGDELLLNYTGFVEEGYDDTEEAFHIKGTGSNRNTQLQFAPSTLATDYNLALRKYMFSKDSKINYLVITYKNPDEWISIQHYYDYKDASNATQRVRSNAKILKTEGTDYYSVILDLTGKNIFHPTNYVNSTTGPMMTFYPFVELASSSTDEYELYIRTIALTETLPEAIAYCEGLWETGDAVGYHVSDGTTTGNLVTPEAPVPMIDITINAENGSVTVNGEAAVEQYEQGSELTLVATPAEGYKFMGWYDVTGGLAPVGNYELLSTDATYVHTVASAVELKARFESTEISDPVFVYDLYNNRETHKHVIHANNFTTSIYDSANEAYRVTGSGAQKEVSFSLNSNSVDTSDAATEARAELIAQEKDIGYMVITYRNPDELANMSRRYINNVADKDHYVYESFELEKSGDKYYSVIVDVSGERLWFRTGTAKDQSQIALYPFMSLSEDDSETYALYFRQVALVKTLDDAKAYCEGLFATYESDGYHTVGGDLVEAPRLELKLDKHAYRMSVGKKLTLGVTVDKDDATITYESSNTNVATVENGVITAVSNGEAEITVEGTKGEYIGADKIKIFVTDIAPVTIDKIADAPVAPEYSPIISFLGDSITAGSHTSKIYHSYLADRLYITAKNKGLSGSNIAGTGSSGQQSFIERVSGIDAASDLIFVMGGTNDFGQNAGTLDRFVPGIRTLIEDLITRFPDKPIVFSTPLQNGGYFSITTNKAGETLAQYVAEIEKACAEYGIPVIQTYRNAAFKDFCIWDGDTVTGYNETYYADGVHPNAAGHEVMADFFEVELEKAGVVEYVKYTTTTINAVNEGMGTITVDGGEAAESVSATVVTGTNITLTATKNDGYKLEGWYEITNGKNVLLSRETSFVYTASKDAVIEARFMDETISIAVKLVASTSEGGFISVNGNTEEDVNDYVNGSSTTELTAIPEEGYVFAYWKRVSCQSGTEIFMSTEATLNAAPLGNTVYYMPVFVAEGTTLNLYLDAQELILSDSEEPEIPSRLGYTGTGWTQASEGTTVNVYKPVYVRAEANTVLTIVYANAETEEIPFKYDDQISIIGTLENPVWTLTANGEETIISYDKEFTFGAAFTSNITLTETVNDNGTDAIVNGVEAVYDSGASLIKFVAMFTLPEGATLNERGVLLTNDASIAADMELNTPNIIVGRVNSDPEDATKTFIINKTKVNAGDTWYGRAYIVYTENGETKTLYATTMEGKAE